MQSTGASASVAALVQLLDHLGKLKQTPRTGWVENKIPQPESISDHMYRMSVLCMMCPDTTLDRNKMIQMALCHDMGESIIGDISPAMKVSKDVKHEKELEAVAQLSSLAKEGGCPTISSEIYNLFLEYEKQETRESHFVKDMDLLEMILQAHIYEGQNPGKDLTSFFKSGKAIQHPWAREIFDHLVSVRTIPTDSKF